MKNYFAESEMQCPCCSHSKMDADFMEKLNKLRESCGFPLMINSGYRCPNHNEKIGSKVNSAHVQGRAADVSCTDGWRRFMIVKNAFELGFKRIGVGKSFVHLDTSEDLPQDVLWVYE